jgi:hypothetical protein
LALALLAGVALVSSGCTSIDLPALPFMPGRGQETRYKGVDGDFQMQTAIGEESYHSVRRALSENAIVLEVDGAGGRVLPLPTEQKAVYVSDLLRQAGVIRKIGHIEATLYRHSPTSIGGLPMEVKMSDDGDTVRPECDYALQAGDRLRVQKAAHPALKGLLSTALGI